MILHNANSIEIHLDRCLNQRHFQAACDHCVGFCPTKAIAQVERQVMLNKESCVGCGLCLKECPTEVYTSKKWDESSLLDALSELETKKVEVFCDLHDNPDVGEKKVGSIQVSTCLGAISQGLWFELGLKCQVGIRLDKCQDCALVSTVSRIKQSIEYANEWLLSCGYEANIVCLENANSPLKRSVRPVISAGEKRMSRRNFFLSFFRTASTPFSDSAKEQITKQESSKVAKLPKHLPIWMERLADVYPKVNQKKGSTAYWSSIKVNDACSACNACTDYCPTGALTTECSADHYRLLFIPGKCIDCRICKETCPKQAITRLQESNTLPFEQQEVYKNKVVQCVRCGKQAVANESNLCYWCAEEPSMTNVLDDARRILFHESNKNQFS
ncbi:4Fe-4S binding protein [Desulfitobacterium hafniense]|uniref:4Fe-4S binding protein n=1 Tax=Desulfitobacterium hafniense TaxID=49338 RepID=UPI00036B0F53|nr:4Fe-4S binding protein [Desulfitobacterium hafniense]